MDDDISSSTQSANIDTAKVPTFKFRVGICGAGISGLALAALLSKQRNIRVDIYESKDEIRTAGAVIALWKRFWTTLDHELDFDRACLEMKATELGGWSTVKPPAIVKADDGNKKAIPIMNVDHGFKSYARQGVLSALLSKLDPKFCKVHTGRRLKYHANLRHGGVMLMFESEKPDNVRSCDILIAADGVHSSIRQEMYEHFPQYTKSIFSGQYAYRMIFSAEALRAKDPNNAALNGFILWCGKDQHFSTFLIGPKIYLTAYENVSPSLSPSLGNNVHSSIPGKVVSLAQGWDLDLVSLITCPPLPDNDGNLATRWAIYTAPTLPFFASGSVALIGDAAHAMMPHQGLGACQGIEDAFVLAKLLGHPLATTRTLEKALRAYDKVRRPVAQRAARDSKVTGEIFDWIHEPFESMSLEEVGREMGRLAGWLREGSCEDVAKEAVRVFERKCVEDYFEHEEII